MAWDGVLVRFGEIGIKSAPVRGAMLERLRANLVDGLLRHGVEGDVQRRGARLWMQGPDADALCRVATMTFGVVSASPCLLVPAKMEGICEAAANLALLSPWTTFAIRARREGQHTFSSQDVQVKAGSAVFVAAEAAGRKPKVQLTKPDFELHIDVRQDKAYLFTHELDGPGGIPLGTQGKVVLLLSDAASCVSAWLLMRRGCRIIPVHAGDTGSVPVDAVASLARWGMPKDIDLLPVCTGSVSKRVLLEAACRVAQRTRCDAVATGETIASELLMGLPLPILRPVCGLDAREVAMVGARLGLEGMDWPASILDDASRETVDSITSMHRTVSP
ncbi:MAG: THUMP domain-containing protein [bacterium]